MNAKSDILHLNLHREFFAQIAAGTKHIEYRSRAPCWRRRLEARHYDVIQSRRHLVLARPGHAALQLGIAVAVRLV